MADRHEHTCVKFSLTPYIDRREVRCQDCGKPHESATKMAEMAYHWGFGDGEASIRNAIREIIGCSN